jgi:hypothetical protein
MFGHPFYGGAENIVIRKTDPFEVALTMLSQDDF